MCFVINQECKCCQDKLHHCKKCWNKYHNGEKHKDYITPDYYGQSMMSKETKEKLEKILGIVFVPNIKEDKKRKYKEGEYH